MTGLALIARRDRPALVGAAVTALDGVVLLALSDAHGEVVLAGLLLGLLIAAAAPRPREANRDGAAATPPVPG